MSCPGNCNGGPDMCGGCCACMEKQAHVALEGMAESIRVLREALEQVGHRGDCPSIERLQPDLKTMKSAGPCDCWQSECVRALEHIA